MKRILIVLVGLLAIVLAACSSGQGASASASASVEPIPSATEEATPEATESAEPSQNPGESQTAGLPSGMPNMHADPELEGRLPDTIGGEPVMKQSLGGEFLQMGQMGQSDPSFQAFLDAFGAEASDISMAIAFPASGASEENPTSITAFRVRGASESDLREQFLASVEDTGDVSGFDNETLAGKSVLVAADPTGQLGGMSFYLYTKDDTIYWMTGTKDVVTEILGALP